MPVDNPIFFLSNRAYTGRLDDTHRGFTMVIQQLLDMPLESFFSGIEDFSLVIRLDQIGESIGSLYQTAQVFIGTTSGRIAEQLARRLGCQLLRQPALIEITTNELQYLFRPPVASDAFAPQWLRRPADFLELLRQKPNLLLHHLLICGKPGSGKSTSLALIIEAVSDHFDSLLILDKKGEYKKLAQRKGFEYIEACQSASLRRLQFNPFIPADNVRLLTHIDELAMNLTVTLFAGAGVLAQGFMRLLLEHYYEALLTSYASALGYRPERNGLFSRFALNLTGKMIRSHLGSGCYYLFENANEGLIRYWETRKDEFVERVFNGVRSQGTLEVLAMISTRMQALKNSLFNSLDYGTEGRSIDHLKGRKIVLSLQGLSLTEIRFLTTLLSTQLFTMTMAGEETSRPEWLVVIEEAQNLASKVGAGSGEVMSGEKVIGDLVSRALAETRSKGLSIACVTQMPSLLVDGVIANTGLKMVHTLVGKDQEAIGHALGNIGNQDFTTLDVGNCWVKIDGDLPFLYHVKP